MARQRSRWGISHVLALVLLVSLVPSIGLEAYHGVQDVHRQRTAIEQAASVQATQATRVIDEYLGSTSRFLGLIAGSPAVQSLDASGSQALFQSAQAQSQNYQSLFLFRMDGTEVASTQPAFEDAQFLQRPYVRAALSARAMSVSDVLAFPGTDQSVVLIAYPVILPSGSEAGVVGLALNIARLSDVIGYAELPSNSVLLLLQQDAMVVAASDQPERWVGRTLGTLPPLSSQPLPNQAGLTQGRMPDGVPRILAYQPVADAPWLMVAGIPQAALTATVQRSLVRVAEEGVLTALATLLLAWLMVRRVVIPIRLLSDGAHAFAAGALDRRIPLRRGDELGTLAESLNGMAAALQRRLDEQSAHTQALEALNQLQTEFVATASHELRTPVAAIRAYAEALLRPDIQDPDLRQSCLEGIDRSSQRLARLARTLLDASRIQSGKVCIHAAPIDIDATVQAAILQAAPDERARINLRTAADLPAVLADPDRLEDVLANLLSNAVKFSPSDSEITIEAKADGGTVVISVRDHGSGIEPAELPKIFDRFYQVNRGSDRHAGGAGLGLFIARAYVEAMRGRLWVASTPGAGSTFSLALPVAPSAEDGGGDARLPAAALASSHR
jgi:signal transduction histidine kinase